MSDRPINDIYDSPGCLNPDLWFADEAPTDFVQELKDCAWNVIRENPGIGRTEWIDTMIRQYPLEVVDAFGTNPPEVYHGLTDLWETEYTDPDTGECDTFR